MKNTALNKLLSIGYQYAKNDSERRTILINNILSFQNIISAFAFGLVLNFVIHPHAMWVIFAYVPFSVLSFVLAHYGKNREAKILNVAFAILYPLFGMSWLNPVDSPPIFWIGNYYLAQVPVGMLVFNYGDAKERNYIYGSTFFLILSYYLFPFFDDWFSFNYHVNFDNQLIYKFGILVAFSYIIGSFLYFLNISNNLKINILKLLNEAGLQNQQLQAQKEELYQNMEELSAQREQLESASSEIQNLQKVQLDELNLELNQRTQIMSQVTATLEFDVDGKILSVNSKFTELLGINTDELRQIRFFDLIIQDDFKADLTEFTLKNINSSDFIQEEIELKTTYKSVWVSITISPLFNSEGKAERFLVIGFSINEIKSQEEYFKQSRENLQFYDEGLSKFTRMMRHESGQSATDWTHQLLSELTDYLGAFQSAIYTIPDDKTEELNLLHAYCFGTEQYLPKNIKFGSGIIGEIARNQEEELFFEEDVKDTIQVGGKVVRLKSTYIMPLLVSDKTEGVLILNSLENISDKSLGLLKKLASNIAVNLAGLRNNLYIQKLLQESKQANDNLKMNEAILQQSLGELEKQTMELFERETTLHEQQTELEKQNKNLEKTIKLHTQDLEIKNSILSEQKEELRQNSEELRASSEKIQELFEQESDNVLELQSILDNIKVVMYQVDIESDKVKFLNEEVVKLTGYEIAEIENEVKSFRDIIYVRDRKMVSSKIEDAVREKMIFEQDYRIQTKNKQIKKVFERSVGIYDEKGKLIRWEGILLDVSNYVKFIEHLCKTKLKKIDQVVKKQLDKLSFTEERLIHAEKLASLGQQVAGIAHEINNPVSYAHNGADSLQVYWLEMRTLLEKYELFEANKNPEILHEIQEYKEEIEYDEVKEDITDLVKDVLTGTGRTLEIVRSMRSFSRKNTDELQDTDIHESIDSTLVILRNNYKHRIEIKKEYDPSLPIIKCFGGQINQVFMNILANAIHSIEKEGKITITTQILEDEPFVVIKIRDTGTGMSEETIDKIFEPYFTTKPQDEGTGLGLPIVKGIIDNHKGQLDVESTLNVGTEFQIFLPVDLM